MNSCNLRGFMQISGSEVVKIPNLSGRFLNKDETSFFPLDDTYDTFENAILTCEQEIDIYLKNDIDGTNIHLGTSSYRLFPNTSLPYSLPFFSFMKKNSYLQANTTLPVSVTYECSLLSKSSKERILNLDEKTLPYYSVYNFRKGQFYTYDSSKDIHSSVSISIVYSK